MTTPREALERIWDGGTTEPRFTVQERAAILTALAPFLRTPGTVERCGQCDIAYVSNAALTDEILAIKARLTEDALYLIIDGLITDNSYVVRAIAKAIRAHVLNGEKS